MKILINTVYNGQRKIHPAMPQKSVLAGEYDCVVVYVDGTQVKRYGSYADRGEEKAAAFAAGIEFAAKDQTVSIEYDTTILE